MTLGFLFDELCLEDDSGSDSDSIAVCDAFPIPPPAAEISSGDRDPTRSVPPTLAGPSDSTGAAPACPFPLTQVQAAAAKASAQRKRNTAKKLKRQRNLPEAVLRKRKRNFVEQSVETLADDFAIEAAPHLAPGYIGLDNRRLDWVFLEGPAHVQMRTLLGMGYQYVPTRAL